MVGQDTEFINDAKQRKKVFEGRAASVLKLASELSTLCYSPVCVVIYNPDDSTSPWRIWPASERELRSMIGVYKKCKGIVSEERTRAEETATAIKTTSADGGASVDFNDERNGSNVKKANSLTLSIDRKIADVQKKIDAITSKKKTHRRWANNAVLEQDLAAVAGDTSSSMSVHAPDVIGNKRKTAEQVFSVSELTSPSLQRRKLEI